MIEDGPVMLVGIDPGDPHVGVAVWCRAAPDDREWYLEECYEATPDDAIDYLFDLCGSKDWPPGTLVVAYERFLLAGGRSALSQSGSELGTVQTIGALKHMARRCGAPLVGVLRSERASARARMKSVGFPFPRGATGHARDAAAVGAYAVGWSATWSSTLAPRAEG